MIFALFLMVVIAVGLGWALYRRDPGALRPAARDGLGGAVGILPNVAMALLVGAFLSVLLPPDWVRFLIGGESGLAGILIASVAGSLMPGGPFVSFPIAVSLMQTGAGLPQIVALITAWSVLGLFRILMFELPVLGGRFVAIRVAASLPLAPAAGLGVQLLIDGVPAVAAIAARLAAGG